MPRKPSTWPCEPTYADVILDKALRIEEEGSAAVEAARKAIEQDILDTPENIQAAAVNLLAFGI